MFIKFFTLEIINGLRNRIELSPGPGTGQGGQILKLGCPEGRYRLTQSCGDSGVGLQQGEGTKFEHFTLNLRPLKEH